MDQVNALFTNLLNIGIGVAVAVSAFFVMWGAFLYMSASGSPRQMEAGKTAIVNALAGTVEQADRLTALAEKVYEYGVKTRLDVDDAQLNRSRALGNLARARRDYLVAGAALLHAVGTLGDGISPPPGGEPAFRPAESPVGVVLEVLGGRPALPLP